MPESKPGRGSLLAGGVAALLASACCLGPLVLVVLGFSGAWIGNLTALEPYRPWFLAAALVANPNKILLRYVLKQELLWDPCLDVVGRRLPNAFIDRAARKRGEELALIAELAQGLDPSSAVLIYPEGTRFSQSKRARALEKLQDKPALFEIAQQMQAVLPPKLAGPLSLLQASPGTDVVILEHQGFEGAASFSEFWGGGLIGRTLRVRLRRISAGDIPDQDRDIWLFRQWAETDLWVRNQAAAQPPALNTPKASTP